MTSPGSLPGIVQVLVGILTLLAVSAAAAGSTPREVLVAEGARLYGRYCAGCHGENGDGTGPAAKLLVVQPRDFTQGIYKFRSTPSGTLPTDEDLYRVLTRGVYRTSMPGWALLAERDRLALLQVVKSFYPDWDRRGAGEPIHLPDPPADLGSEAAVSRGRELYDMLGCASCHGPEGRGDGESAAKLEPDAWGNPQRPFDFTSGRLKSGPTVKDVYRTFMTGINGTSMPSYFEVFGQPDGQSIREGDAWNLVSYILSLRRPEKKSTVRTTVAR